MVTNIEKRLEELEEAIQPKSKGEEEVVWIVVHHGDVETKRIKMIRRGLEDWRQDPSLHPDSILVEVHDDAEKGDDDASETPTPGSA